MTTDMSLVEKLRYLSELKETDLGSVPSTLLREAADRLASQADSRAFQPTRVSEDKYLGERSDAELEASFANMYHGWDRGLNITQEVRMRDGEGTFTETPMTEMELAARYVAAEIGLNIFEIANKAAFAPIIVYSQIQARIGPVFERLASIPVPQEAGAVATIDHELVKEAMQDGGFWKSCCGCHELNDGAPTGPYNNALQCHVGNGCTECGGIGAVWDDGYYPEVDPKTLEFIPRATLEDVTWSIERQNMKPYIVNGAKPICAPASPLQTTEALVRLHNEAVQSLFTTPAQAGQITLPVELAERLRDYLYNPFEPDNQSQIYMDLLRAFPIPAPYSGNKSDGSVEVADTQKPEISSVEFRGKKSFEAPPGSRASSADATALRSSAGVASGPSDHSSAQSADPDGMVMVPREPTEEMIRAAYAEQPNVINAGFAQAYRCMIAAAHTPTTKSDEGSK